MEAEDTQVKQKFIGITRMDENKIYDVGGYWYYSGKNNIKVKVKRNKKDTYDFWKVTYHNIDFTTLTGE